MKALRQVQLDKSNELNDILRRFKIAFLFGKTRSGKTLTALNAVHLFGAKKVLFITTKKAMKSIQEDYEAMFFDYKLTLVNYESVHKIENNDFDFLICDESHKLSAFPKPSIRAKFIRTNFSNLPIILMTGTPAAESASQYYHQFFISDYSPFINYQNFYKWSKDFVSVEQKRIGTHTINDYSNGKFESILKIINPYIVRMTRKEAGIELEADEHYRFIEVPERLRSLAERLIKERAIVGNDAVLSAETPAKLQSKIHQIFNGSVILEDYNGDIKGPIILSPYKADYIKENFKGKRLAIMYYYQAEWEILKQVFGDKITNDLNEFHNSGTIHIAMQQSSIEGVNLSLADCLIFMNFGFSAKNYLQALTRLTVKGRTSNDVYFVLEKNGINSRILNALKNKENYHLESFKNDFL
jgi:hypothetical protein